MFEGSWMFQAVKKTGIKALIEPLVSLNKALLNPYLRDGSFAMFFFS